MDKISSEKGWISLGPWGGKNGVYSTYKLDGPIMQITIRHGVVIDSILFESKSRDGIIIGAPVKMGGTGGEFSAKLYIDSSVEQFSSISLTYTDYFGAVVLTSLCFITNLKKYGPFGSGGGHSVNIPIEGQVIMGFHGHIDHRGYLGAIGIFVAPKVDSFPNSETNMDNFHSIVQDPDFAPTQLKINYFRWDKKDEASPDFFRFCCLMTQLPFLIALSLCCSFLMELFQLPNVLRSLTVKVSHLA